MRLLEGLQKFDITTVKKDMSSKAKSAIKELKKMCSGLDGPDLIKEIKNKSSAAAGLYKWASATDKYYDIFRMVEPKKKAAEEMQKAKEKAELELAETLAALKEVTDTLKELNAA